MQKNDTQKFFNSYAIDFDAIYGNENNLLNKLVNKYLRKAMMLRFMKTVEGCQPVCGKTFIDIGCGSGYYSVHMAKMGAKAVVGIDFAQGMIDLARKNAAENHVEDKCRFIAGDFITTDIKEKFDYAIVMGVMDYIEEPETLIKKVISVTNKKAFFSFPVEGGILALQRKWRYKRRCALYMYSDSRLRALVAGLPVKNAEIEKISRDFFVCLSV